MRGRAQGQLPVWTLNGLRHQQAQQRQTECEAEGMSDNGDEHIVKAVAVTADEMLEGDVVYANAESMPSAFKLFFRDRNFRIVFAVFLLALIGGIIGLSLWLTNRGQGASSDFFVEGPTNMPTAAPTITMAPTVDISPAKDVLSMYSSLEDLNRRGSPQHSAMLWMVNTDELAYAFDESYLTPITLQRYAIVVLYYAMHECSDEWVHDDEHWLAADKHECEWSHGISCQSYAGNQFIAALDLSELGACGPLPPEIGLFDKLGEYLCMHLLLGTISRDYRSMCCDL